MEKAKKTSFFFFFFDLQCLWEGDGNVILAKNVTFFKVE